MTMQKASVLAVILLVVLAAEGLFTGGWALFSPATFYADFPGFRAGWVSADGPYNEHLVRDVGALSLSLTVLLTAAAMVPARSLIRIATIAYAAYAIPHTVFHGLHLHGFPAPDAVAQMAGFATQLLAAALALLTTLPRARPSRPRTEVTAA